MLIPLRKTQASNMSVSVVLKNGCSTCGEGPHWDDVTKCLSFVDIMAGDCHRWDSQTGDHEKIHIGNPTSFIIPREKGGYIVSQGLQLAQLDWQSKQLKPILSVDSEKPKNRFNDAKCDTLGRLWAGTMGYETYPGEIEREVAHLYMFDKEQNLHTIKDKVNISNGMAWTADNRTFFYTHSMPRKVFAYDFDLVSGNISKERVVVDFTEKSIDEFGIPDGMTIDLNDKIWLACYFSSRIFQIDPETGKILQTIKFETSNITSCCFGGPNYDELYATSSTIGLTAESLAKQPLAGSIFKVNNINAKGVPGVAYQG